jgi:hypothetical protein
MPSPSEAGTSSPAALAQGAQGAQQTPQALPEAEVAASRNVRNGSNASRRREKPQLSCNLCRRRK